MNILARARDRKFKLVQYSRFVLDEIHERSVDTDVLVALLAEKMVEISFPLQLLMMSATSDPRILKSFNEVHKINLPDTQLFPIEDIKKSLQIIKILIQLFVTRQLTSSMTWLMENLSQDTF